MSPSKAQELMRISPKQIREKIAGRPINESVIIVDQQWTGRPIDTEVGDLILTDKSISFEGKCLSLVEENLMGRIYCGVRPGIGRLVCSKTDWASYIRVSRQQYTGLNLYRHLEDPDYDQNFEH
jgi:hypothetical protein